MHTNSLSMKAPFKLCTGIRITPRPIQVFGTIDNCQWTPKIINSLGAGPHPNPCDIKSPPQLVECNRVKLDIQVRVKSVYSYLNIRLLIDLLASNSRQITTTDV